MMKREELIFVGTCDLAGHVRGKGFPAADLPARLRKGIGLTHSNIMMSAFGPIDATPFGTLGDPMLVPDPTTKVHVGFGELGCESFYLGDIRTTEGEPWECCPREFLRRALADLRTRSRREAARGFRAGIRLYRSRASPGCHLRSGCAPPSAALWRIFIAAIREAGLRPDSFCRNTARANTR